MTGTEATTLGLQLLGAIGCAAGVSVALVALDAEDASGLWAAGRILGIGAIALLVATMKDDRGDGAKRGKPSP